jgi:hypothetical protein
MFSFGKVVNGFVVDRQLKGFAKKKIDDLLGHA